MHQLGRSCADTRAEVFVSPLPLLPEKPLQALTATLAGLLALELLTSGTCQAWTPLEARAAEQEVGRLRSRGRP